MKHTLLLTFKNKEEAMEFLGQLSDGFGEEYVDVHPTDRSVVHWDDTTEFDVELVSESETYLRRGWGYTDNEEDNDQISFDLPVYPFSQDPEDLANDAINRLQKLIDENLEKDDTDD